MLTIQKQTLQITEHQSVWLPDGANILDIQLQNGLSQIWYLCNPKATTRKFLIRINGTGHPIAGDIELFKYISTFQASSHGMAFHTFAKQE